MVQLRAITISKQHIKDQVNATFNNGVPTGKWNFTRKTNDTQNIVNKEDKDVSNSAFATFTNGKLTAFSTTWGTNITIDNEGKISGKSGKYTIDKGFALVFERTNGALSPLEKEQKDIVTLLKESKLSHSEVIDKGYTIKIIELDISGYQWFYDNITQTGRASFYFENDDTGRILPEDNDNKIPSYLSCNLTILKRIDKDNYASFEDCMKFCNENTWGYDYIVENNYITNGYNGKLYINTIKTLFNLYLSLNESKKLFTEPYPKKKKENPDQFLLIFFPTLLPQGLSPVP